MNQTEFSNLRQQYPDPRSFKEAAETYNNYCIGGALVFFISGEDIFKASVSQRFPYAKTVATTIQSQNSRLSKNQALTIAAHIIDRNDEGNFERSWEILRQAVVVEKPLTGEEKWN